MDKPLIPLPPHLLLLGSERPTHAAVTLAVTLVVGGTYSMPHVHAAWGPFSVQ
jgi:hypothetical protein